MVSLEQRAFALLATFLAFDGFGVQDSSDGFIEDVLQTSLSEGAALHVLHATQFLRQIFGLFFGDGSHPLVLETSEGVRILAQVDLGADQEFGHIGAVVRDFGVPFGTGVFEGRRGDHREANQKDVGLRIA